MSLKLLKRKRIIKKIKSLNKYMDPIIIINLTISILAALGHFVNQSHIKKLKCLFCIESDCNNKRTPPNTPTDSNSTNV
jgi:hypothetical protein